MNCVDEKEKSQWVGANTLSTNSLRASDSAIVQLCDGLQMTSDPIEGCLSGKTPHRSLPVTAKLSTESRVV